MFETAMSQTATTRNRVLKSGPQNNEDAMVSGIHIGKGSVTQTERWPFGMLRRGNYFQVDDLEMHTAVRTAATRAKKRYKRNFSVRKVTLAEGHQVIRVYRVP